MTTNLPFLLRFATRFGRVAESGEPENTGASIAERDVSSQNPSA